MNHLVFFDYSTSFTSNSFYDDVPVILVHYNTNGRLGNLVVFYGNLIFHHSFLLNR